MAQQEIPIMMLPRESIAELRFLRRLIIPALRRLGDRDITIRHHLTGTPFRLHAFRHKTYWFYGAQREREVMSFAAQIAKPGSQVVDVGAHIGYMSAYFSRLVGERGRVFAFEPGANNLPYLRANVRNLSNVTIVEKALSNSCGTAKFLLEDLSGQNNSLISDAHLQKATAGAFVAATIQTVDVETVTLDSFCAKEGVLPDLVKIDAEESELVILQGMREMMRAAKPAIIVEVWDNREAILELLFSSGYRVSNSDLSPVNQIEDLHTDNVFAVWQEPRHGTGNASRGREYP
jgi:FkbM family methyltransferase